MPFRVWVEQGGGQRAVGGRGVQQAGVGRGGGDMVTKELQPSPLGITENGGETKRGEEQDVEEEEEYGVGS